jgi:two-component system, OmpR family, alkaline phosphatase synthesis response regulator PhoP
MKMLVADDDRDLRELIGFTLTQAGYLVVKAADGPAALRMFEAETPDLVVLDINMPGASGFQVCEAIRKRSRVPVIMLTVRGEEEDLVRALELGADDYLTKPFGLGELLARVEALLRRRPADPRVRDRVRFGDVEVDLGSQTVARAGQPLEITSQEFKVLRLFLETRGRAMSREDILARCWGADYGGTPRTVDNFIRSLRVKLERDPEAPQHILTVRGMGYRFER